ncbi:MAG: cupin domain-containing protein [Thiotrichales bacterium]
MTQIIEIISDPEPELVAALGIAKWPTWSKEISSFPWRYDTQETCYLLEGEVLISVEGEEPLLIQARDLVTFPAGLECHWEIRKPVLKHYHFAASGYEEPVLRQAAM